MSATAEGLVIDRIGGNCPVEIEGAIDGQEFYFRARGMRWSLSVGGRDVVGAPDWYYEEPYGDQEFAAGWMSEEEARAFLDKAARLWRESRTAPGPG